MRTLPGLGIVSMATGKVDWNCHVESDDLILVIVETGVWFGNERGRDIRLTPGSATFCSKIEASKGVAYGRRAMIRVPHETIAPMCGGITDSFYRPIAPDTDALRLIRPYVRAIQDHAVTPGLQRVAATHVHDLLALLIGATRDGTEVARGRGLAAARLQAIKDDIARNLEDGDVSGGAIAMRHQVTVRYIQMLFENEGVTFTAYVTARRLERAHRLLTGVRYQREKISTIAYDAGFKDLSHFNRLFRRRYGASPSDVRAQAGHLN